MSCFTAIEKPTLSQILQDLLREKGISVSELARQASLPQPTIQRIASGTHSRPHEKTLKILATYFGITQNQLRGQEQIPWLSIKKRIPAKEIPFLEIDQVTNWSLQTNKGSESIIVDINLGPNSYALKMPDPSMEPLIPKGSILIVDPNKEYKYRSFVFVKIKNYKYPIIRQLIIDAGNYYIKPLSPDLNQFKMIQLNPEDKILGVIIQVRFNCSE